MCVLVLCILHEVRIKRVELHCKWRLVVPSVTVGMQQTLVLCLEEYSQTTCVEESAPEGVPPLPEALSHLYRNGLCFRVVSECYWNTDTQ